MMPKREQKCWFLVAKAEPLNYKIDVFFDIIVCCTSREEIQIYKTLRDLGMTQTYNGNKD